MSQITLIYSSPLPHENINEGMNVFVVLKDTNNDLLKFKIICHDNISIKNLRTFIFEKIECDFKNKNYLGCHSVYSNRQLNDDYLIENEMSIRFEFM